MNLKLTTVVVIAVLMGAVSCKKGSTSGSKSPDNPTLKTKMDSVSYALGNVLGMNLKQAGLSDSTGLNYETLKIAMERSIAGDSLSLNEMKVRAILEAFQKEQMAKQEAIEKGKNAPIVAKNEKLAAEYLAKNKTASGVVTTTSGLQYKIIKPGTGAKPVDGQRVKVHYTGKLVDGKVFDSSIQRGEPVVFGVNEVIPGWTEGLKLMPVGSKWELVIPPAIGYGTQGNQAIPGGSLLIFEVELLSIEK